jgi:hypothetical protein
VLSTDLSVGQMSRGPACPGFVSDEKKKNIPLLGIINPCSRPQPFTLPSKLLRLALEAKWDKQLL